MLIPKLIKNLINNLVQECEIFTIKLRIMVKEIHRYK